MANPVTATLSAGVASDVTVTGRGAILIIHHGNVTDPVYFRNDGTTAVVAADNNKVVLPSGYRVVRTSDKDGTIVTSCICATAARVTVSVVEPDDYLA